MKIRDEKISNSNSLLYTCSGKWINKIGGREDYSKNQAVQISHVVNITPSSAMSDRLAAFET